MNSRKQPGVTFWATVAVVVVLAYPLSFGPVCRYISASEMDENDPPDWLMTPTALRSGFGIGVMSMKVARLSSSAFTTVTIPQYTLQRIGVDFKVSVNPTTATKDVYELTDSIAARNSTRCVTAGGCAVPSVP